MAEKAVIESLEEVLAENELEYEYISKNDDAINAEEIAIQEALNRLEVKEQRIKEAYENEVDTLEEYKQNKLRLKLERDELLADAEKLRQQMNQCATAPTKEEIMRQVAHVHEILSDPNLDYEIKGNALRNIVKDIVFDRSNGHLYIHFYIS